MAAPPATLYSRLAEARRLVERGDYQRAREELLAILSAEPSCVEALGLLDDAEARLRVEADRESDVDRDVELPGLESRWQRAAAAAAGAVFLVGGACLTLWGIAEYQQRGAHGLIPTVRNGTAFHTSVFWLTCFNLFVTAAGAGMLWHAYRAWRRTY
ncbi:MAG: hypothetical protein ACK47B_28815 [Armatimonadota bacterium]